MHHGTNGGRKKICVFDFLRKSGGSPGENGSTDRSVSSWQYDRRRGEALRSHIWLEMTQNIRTGPKITKIQSTPPQNFRKKTTNFAEDGNSATLEYKTTENPKSLKELLSTCGVDTKKWEVDRYVVNKWEVAMRIDGKVVHRPLFQVKAWLIRIIPITSLLDGPLKGLSPCLK